MSTKPQKGSEKYKRILNAAIRVFARNGFYASKVSQVAKEAKVADGTIYLYFKNKDDILISLFEDKMDEIIRRLNVELEGVTDVNEKLRLYIGAHLHLAESDPDLADVISVELRQSTHFMKEYENRKFNEYLKILANILREGQELGVWRTSISPTVFCRGLFGMLDELTVFQSISRHRGGGTPKYDMNVIQEQVADFVIRGLKI